MSVSKKNVDHSEGITYMLGDWNFVHASGSRMTGSSAELDISDYLGPSFEGACAEVVEWAQHDFTFRRLARQTWGEALFSKIDRIYCNAHPMACEDFLIQVAVRGAWVSR